MRLESLAILDATPVLKFEVADLADVVVLAGPNGVGKTRLLEFIVNHLRNAQPNPNVRGVLRATSQQELKEWHKDALDLSMQDDMDLFRSTLQQSRRRQRWRSSLLNFESDRTIQNLQPLQFSWDLADFEKENVSWDSTFGYMHDRFQDTVHSMYRMIEAQRQGYGTRAVDLGRQGRTSMNLDYSDPMEPFKGIFSLLLAPKELVDPSVREQQLKYSFDDQVLPFSSLSSGEREVVNVAFDFLLRSPRIASSFSMNPSYISILSSATNSCRHSRESERATSSSCRPTRLTS
ncbi:MAG: hypothetical protein ABI879_04190 [Actinomycetota bacterium]